MTARDGGPNGPTQAGAARPARARRRGGLWVAVALGLAVGLVGGALALDLRSQWAARMGERVLTARAGPDGRIAILVFGVDQNTHDPGRTDTILVVSVDVPGRRVGVLFIPRDTRVRVGAGRFGKINGVYPSAGPAGLVRVVSQLVGVPLDGYVRLDFQAFSRLVDAIGGVEVVIERPMRYVDRAQQLYIDLPAGRYRLYGRDALDYVRFRADGLGDVSFDRTEGVYRGRLERQQRFIGNVLAELRRPQVLWNLPRLARELHALVETDLPADLAVAAALWLRSRPPVELVTGVLPGTPGTVGPVSYWLPDTAAVPAAVRRVLGGAPPPGQVGTGAGPGVAEARSPQGMAGDRARARGAGGWQGETRGKGGDGS